MQVNAFIGTPHQPSNEELEQALGDAGPLWNQLLSALAEEHGLTEMEWNSYSAKAGWALRVKSKKRNIVYLSPGRGTFMASFALGDRAMAAAKVSKLPKSAQRILAEARRYAEGSAVRISVTSVADLQVVKKLAKIKLEH